MRRRPRTAAPQSADFVQCLSCHGDRLRADQNVGDDARLTDIFPPPYRLRNPEFFHHTRSFEALSFRRSLGPVKFNKLGYSTPEDQQDRRYAEFFTEARKRRLELDSGPRALDFRALWRVFGPLRREHVQIDHRFVADHFAPMRDVAWDDDEAARPDIMDLVADVEAKRA